MATLKGRAALELLDNFYPPWAELGRDQTVCVAHHCETGHKKRLYITNKGGMYVFYCHHCGDKGIYLGVDRYSPIREGTPIAPVYREGPQFDEVLSKVSFGWGNLSQETRLWLSSHYVDETMYNRMPRVIGQLSDCCALIGGEYGQATHIQVRGFSGRGPKYRTVVRDSARGNGVFCGNPASPVVFVTEDMLSAYRLAEAGGRAYCLMGTKKRDNMPTAQHCVLWLDPDSAGCQGAQDLTRELSPLYNSVTSVPFGSMEPKHMNPSELRVIVNRYL